METTQVTIPPGRHSFDNSGLKGHAMAILRTVTREQLCQREYLKLRTDVESSQAFRKATATARGEFYVFLRGAIEMLFVTEQIDWFHRVNAEWVRSPARMLRQGPNTDRTGINYSKLDPNNSQFLWVESKKPWFEVTP